MEVLDTMTNTEVATKVMDLLDELDPEGEQEVTRRINKTLADWGVAELVVMEV